METPNIFAVLQKVSSRTEPTHSAFPGEMLRWSIHTDQRLFHAFWQLATPQWPLPDESVIVIEEVILGTGRVDLVLLVGTSRVVGIEVKTREGSTTPGQLARYREGLAATYPDRGLAIAFLTPFDRKYAGDAAFSLRSIAEF